MTRADWLAATDLLLEGAFARAEQGDYAPLRDHPRLVGSILGALRLEETIVAMPTEAEMRAIREEVPA